MIKPESEDETQTVCLDAIRTTLSAFVHKPDPIKTESNLHTLPSTPIGGLRRSPRKPTPSRRYTPHDEDLLPTPSPIPRSRSSTSSPFNKKVKAKRGFAPAERYSHLAPLPDYFCQELDIVFCGINPGQKSAEVGHHFSGPTNHFYPCLYESGLTSERIRPTEDYTLPDCFSLGLTNLVDRPTAEQNELSRAEQVQSVPTFLEKVTRYRPLIICFVGLGIADIVKSRVLPKSDKKKKIPTTYGVQPYKLIHNTNTESSVQETLFFAIASTSGRVVQYHKSHKIEMFKELKDLRNKVKEKKYDTSDIPAIEVTSLT